MMKRRKKRILAWAGVVLCGVSALALWQWHLTVHFTEATATVISLDSRYVGETGGMYGHPTTPHYRPDLVVEYSVDNEPVRSEVVASEYLHLRPGDVIKIKYRKRRPDKCFVIE